MRLTGSAGASSTIFAVTPANTRSDSHEMAPAQRVAMEAVYSGKTLSADDPANLRCGERLPAKPGQARTRGIPRERTAQSSKDKRGPLFASIRALGEKLDRAAATARAPCLLTVVDPPVACITAAFSHPSSHAFRTFGDRATGVVHARQVEMFPSQVIRPAPDTLCLQPSAVPFVPRPLRLSASALWIVTSAPPIETGTTTDSPWITAHTPRSPNVTFHPQRLRSATMRLMPADLSFMG